MIDADRTDAPLADAPDGDGPPPPAIARRRGGGPKTPEGKLRSRRSSLKHGLCSKEVLPDDLAAIVARRTAEFVAEFQPRSPYEQFLVREMALASARLDRCAAMTIVDIGRGIERALLCWDHDRRMAVEELGARLAKDPARVAWSLRGCTQGADWLIERWEALGTILKNTGTWTEEQRRLAFDMLGVAPALREGSDAVPPPDDVPGMAALVAREVERLRARQEEALDRLDRTRRAMAADGMPLEEDAATARLRKYEGSCRRAFNAARAELLRLREAKAAPEPSKAGPPPSHRAPLSDAAVDYLAKRARVANEVRAEARAAQAQAAIVERPAAAPAPAPSRSAMVPAAAPLNRRERRAQAKRDRQAARRAASAR